MKTVQNSRPVISQTENNTTLWIGHLRNVANERLAGQTFQCPADGLLDNIQVWSSAVSQEGEVLLTLHEFDATSQNWGPSIGESNKHLQKEDTACWIRFELQPTQLEKNKVYGFRLQSKNALVGLGEAATYSHRPFSFGQAWSSDTSNLAGKFFRYFSLAFKVEVCA